MNLFQNVGPALRGILGEIKTHSHGSLAGLSNMVAGLTGAGMTGSYIFSQTIFSMRAGVKTRIHGIIIAGEHVLYLSVLQLYTALPQEARWV